MTEQEAKEYLLAKHTGLLLTKKETAVELHISPANLDRLRQTGQIESKKIGGKVLFNIGEVARFLAV